MSVDGSFKKNPDGTNSAGYAEETLKAEPLPHHYSAQAAETVTEACKTGKDKDVTVYTDGHYAFSCIQQWKNRGMVTSTGKAITHRDLIFALLDAVQLPRKVAICKCVAHATGTGEVSIGNGGADEAAKEAAVKQSHTHTQREMLRQRHFERRARKCNQNGETTVGEQRGVHK